MNRRIRSAGRPAALLALIIALAPSVATAQSKWWQSERFQRELQLSADQIARIEEVFQSAMPELRKQKKTLDRAEDDLSRLIDISEEEAPVMAQADRVEQIRSELSKARTLMLLRMRLALTAEQRVKLAALHEEWERNRKRDRHE
jgi:Spy/CpxP family protein refolding chaperone